MKWAGDPDEDEPGTTMLFLVRHAHSDWIPDEMRSLSAQGHAAAGRVADVLQPHGITRIYSSPYARAMQTVQPLATRLGLPIHTDLDLRERDLSSKPVRDFRRAVEATWRDFDFAHPGGESSAVAQRRVSGAIRRVWQQSKGRAIVIASHGNAIALFLRTLDPSVDYDFWSKMSTPDIHAVDASGDTWTFERIWKE